MRKEKKKSFSQHSDGRSSMVGARRSAKKSRSTHRELRVGTKILEFRQTPLGREFSYLNFFSSLKGI